MSRNPSPKDPALRVFVYGTLKSGYGNHSSLCREYGSCVPGMVRGRVVDRPEGFPTLFAPVDDVLALGTTDRQADCRLIADFESRAQSPRSGDKYPHSLAEPWRYVAGEVYTFFDGAQRLRALDMLESFIPHEPSMYCRVVLPVRTSQETIPCWAYISPHSARFEADHAGPP